MDAVKAKLAEWSKDKGLVKLAAIVTAVVLILMITCCISIHMRVNIQKKYSTAIDALQTQGYQNMENMTELFGRIDDPNVDVRYKLIPELKAQYSALSAVNTALLDCGEKYALLTREEMEAFDASFALYASAYQQGSATGLAKADLAACMENVQAMVTERNAPEEPEDDVVIINASSGKIEGGESTSK